MPGPSETTQTRGLVADRAGIIEAFGVTPRQARFLALIMHHSGVFMGRQYAAFAGITYGQKVHDFVERLLARVLATALRLGPSGRTRIFHVHHKPMYPAIGEPNNRHRKPVAIGRAVERMMLLDAVLAEPACSGSGRSAKSNATSSRLSASGCVPPNIRARSSGRSRWKRFGTSPTSCRSALSRAADGAPERSASGILMR